jgi:outer membrane protein assembly factor BamB
MSLPGERQQSARDHWPRVRMVLMVVAGLTFALLSFYHLFLADRSYADPEQLLALNNLALDRSRSNGSAGRKDWPQWRGPGRDGVSTEADLLLDWPAPGPPKLWDISVGVGYSAVAIAQGQAYTLMQDGDDEAVVCWDALTGAEKWRFRYPARYRNSYGDGPRSTPAVSGPFVYTVGGTGIMHCLKTEPASAQGDMVWRKDLLGEFGAANLKWGVSFSPLVDGDLVFTNPGGPNGSVAALDKATGALRWKNFDDQAGYASPIAAEIAGKRQIIFFTETGLVSVAPADGALLWRFPWQTSYGCNVATPIVLGDYVFISSGYNHGCALIHVEATPNGFQPRRVFENRRMRNHFSSSVYAGGYLFGFDEATLVCMEFRTGQVQWKKGGFGKGSLIAAGPDLIILGDEGQLAVAEATPAGYHEKTSCRLPEGQYWTMPALANGRLYIRSQTRLMCLDLRKTKDDGKAPVQPQK